jgi:hypothetical protein
MPKKTLITKFYHDVSGFSDAMIDLQKAFIKVAAGETRVEFEVVTENEETDNATAERLLNQVRAEFSAADAGSSIGLGQLSEEQRKAFQRFLASESDDERTMDEP